MFIKLVYTEICIYIIEIITVQEIGELTSKNARKGYALEKDKIRKNTRSTSSLSDDIVSEPSTVAQSVSDNSFGEGKSSVNKTSVEKIVKRTVIEKIKDAIESTILSWRDAVVSVLIVLSTICMIKLFYMIKIRLVYLLLVQQKNNVINQNLNDRLQ